MTTAYGRCEGRNRIDHFAHPSDIYVKSLKSQQVAKTHGSRPRRLFEAEVSTRDICKRHY